jgi:hypothetical protein
VTKGVVFLRGGESPIVDYDIIRTFGSIFIRVVGCSAFLLRSSGDELVEGMIVGPLSDEGSEHGLALSCSDSSCVHWFGGCGHHLNAPLCLSRSVSLLTSVWGGLTLLQS